MSEEHPIGPTERRYVVRPQKTGRNTTYGIYDRQTASWPVSRADFGMVRQAMATEAEAQAEADRLERTR